MACEETLPAPYQNMTPEQALDEAFKLMLKDYGKTKHKLITSRQSTKEILRGILALSEEKAKSTLTDVLQILLDMFDIAEMTFDHIHDTKLIYGVYKRQRSRLYTGEKTQ
ncbi:hypothetical protein ES702_00569 [subsurface metagenome]